MSRLAAEWGVIMEFRHELVLPNGDLPFRMFIFEGKNGNYKVSKHWHQSIEIFLVLEGKIDFYINSVQYSLEQGQFILVNSNEIHSIDSPNPNFIIVLQIPIKNFFNYAEEDYIHFKSTLFENDAGLIELIKTMYQVYEKKEYGYALEVLSNFYKLLYILIKKYKVNEIDEERVRQNKHLDKLSKITRYIKDNFNEEITLKSVADIFGFTPTYLSRMFQKYASINYKTYLLNIRVDAGYKQLVNTGDSISEIAVNCGFSDSRSFAKAFKKRYGRLPSDYRKELKKDKKVLLTR